MTEKQVDGRAVTATERGDRIHFASMGNFAIYDKERCMWLKCFQEFGLLFKLQVAKSFNLALAA